MAIDASGTRAAMRATIVRIWTSRAFRRRRELVGRRKSVESASTASASFEAATDEKPRAVDDDRDHEQDHPESDERFGMKRLGGLVEFVGDHARQREPWREDGRPALRGVADPNAHARVSLS